LAHGVVPARKRQSLLFLHRTSLAPPHLPQFHNKPGLPASLRQENKQFLRDSNLQSLRRRHWLHFVTAY
jgi:hypothetical protein